MKEMNLSGLFVGGEHLKRQTVRDKHENAIQSVASIICTSFGPLGLDKMCIDHTGEVTCTNDGATILKNMNLNDPSAKMMVDLAKQQDEEVGDGTTSVVLLAASLVEKGNQMIKRGIHPSNVISGYKFAFKESVNFIKKHLQVETGKLSQNILKSVVETSISSKIIKGESEHFSKIIVDAIKMIEDDKSNGDTKNFYDLNLINILKKQGGSMKDSFLINGFALNCSLASTQMIKKIKNPKILCISFSIRKVKLPLGIDIRIEDPDKLEEIRKKEISIMKERVGKIIKSGANVILTSGGIDDVYIKQFIDNECMAVRRVKEEDLAIIANAIGIPVISSLSDLEGEDISPHIGLCDSISVEDISDRECIIISGLRKKMATIILRGANEQLLEEMHRSVFDALSALKRTLEHKTIVPGGGAVEVALSVHLDNFANSICSKDQLSTQKYSEALLIIPKILAANAGFDSNELVAKLLTQQIKTKNTIGYKHGLNVITGNIQDNIKGGIVEPTISKLKALRFATEVAIGVLRIDEVINIDEEIN